MMDKPSRRLGTSVKRPLSLLLALILTVLSVSHLASCGTKKLTDDFFAMDTFMTATYYGSDAEKAAEDVKTMIKTAESDFGVTSATGSVALLNSSGRLESPSSDLLAMLSLARELYLLTDGAYDITVLPLVSLWGFDGGEKRVPSDDEIISALGKVGLEKLSFDAGSVTLARGVGIDLGSLAKGLVAGKALGILEESAVSGAVLSLGGNVQTYGEKPDGSDFVIGIADPFAPESVTATLCLKGGKAVVTSGTYQRYFVYDGKTYHHILDARTGRPSESDLVSVTVVCDDPLTADGYSTALFLLGKDKATEFLVTSSLEAVLIDKDGNFTVTSGLEDVFSSSNASVGVRFAEKTSK